MCIYIYIYEHTYVHVCNLYEFSVATTKNHYKAVGLKLLEKCVK